MTIPYTGTGGLFTRIGKAGGILNVANFHRGTIVPPKVDSLFLDYSSAEQDVVGALYTNLSSYQSSAESFLSYLKKLASDTVVSVCEDASPIKKLPQLDALSYLISAMKTDHQTVKSSNVSAAVIQAPGNHASHVGVISLKWPDGRNNENIMSEGVTATVTVDSQSSPSNLYNESYTFSSPKGVTNKLDWRYPNGSGVATNTRAVDALKLASGNFGNYINNGSFENFTVPDLPDGWHTAPGASAGVNVKQATTIFLDGLSSLAILGDGSHTPEVRQQFTLPGRPTADTVTVGLLQQFAVNLFLRASSNQPVGVITVSLTNGTTVINDDQGVPNSFTVPAASITTSFLPFSGVFRTPSLLPAAIYLSVKMSTAFPGGFTVYVDRLAMTQMGGYYRNGPSVAIFSDQGTAIKGDAIVFNVSNDYGGKFQQLFNKFFDMLDNGLQLPSSASPTIPDSLIA